MDNAGIWLILFAVVLIFVAILAAVIGYFWASSATKSALLKQIKEQGNAAFKQAQDQLQNWKEQELSSIRQQTFDAAKGQAIQEMQEQAKKWQETELQQTRQQIYDAVKGQATQEMQEQIRKWKENELQQVRQQISEAARGQAIQEMQEQVQKWQQNELQQIQLQIYDVAKGQAVQEMQERVRQWQENELQQIRQQMFEAVRGEAIRDAQNQLIKWRGEDLENAKRQIWDVLNKEATVSLEQWKVEAEKEIRKDAIDKSQSVTMGKMTEHMVPYLPGFGFNPTDARFIGSPIDLIVFDGLSEDCVKKIVFVEIKTGVSNLSSRERLVREAINAGKIEWMEVKANLEGPDVVYKVKSRRNSVS
jgi:predicted Holliday junction resolvase-like endonuclease